MQKCEYFKIYELVDPATYKARGQKAWELLDPRLLLVIDRLRAIFGPVTINDWKWGGRFKLSGFRPVGASQKVLIKTGKNKGKYKMVPVGAVYSQHKFGRAMDLKFKNATAKQVRDFIRQDQAAWGKIGIRCIENKVSWLHVDVRNCKPIKWVNP